MPQGTFAEFVKTPKSPASPLTFADFAQSVTPKTATLRPPVKKPEPLQPSPMLLQSEEPRPRRFGPRRVGDIELRRQKEPQSGPLVALRKATGIGANPKKQGPLGLADFFKGLVTDEGGERRLSDKGTSLLPFIGPVTVATDAYNVVRAARRIRDDKGTLADEQIVQDFVERDAEAQTRGTTRLYDIANVVAQLPGFAVEFATTGGAFAATKKTIEEAILKVATNRAARIAAKTAGYAAGAAVQTAAMPQRVAQGVTTRQAPTVNDVAAQLEDWDDDFLPALAKAVPDQYVEVFSERTGAVLAGPMAKLAKLPIAQKATALKTAVMQRWLNLHPSETIATFLEKVKSEAAWNGILGEMFEERVGEAARAALPDIARDPSARQAPMVRVVTGQPLPMKDPATARRDALRDFGSGLFTEAAAFAVPGVAKGALTMLTSRRGAAPAPPTRTFADFAAQPTPAPPATSAAPVVAAPPPTQAERNAQARAEAAAAGPASRDLEAVEAGRALERRVREGISPTGEERRLLPSTVSTEVVEATGQPIEEREAGLRQSRLGNAGSVNAETGEITGIHVTSDVARVVKALDEGDVIKTHSETFQDLGPGLYVSGTPQLWMGRAPAKWDFVETITPEERTRLVSALRERIAQDRSTQYITENEQETANSYIDQLEGGYTEAAVMLADQPYNLRWWEPSFLEPLKIKPGTQPAQIPVRLRGTFADLSGQQVTDEAITTLRKQGFDGAFQKGGMVEVPQLVVWNPKAVHQFGDWTQKTEIPLTGQSESSRINEVPVEGGTPPERSPRKWTKAQIVEEWVRRNPTPEGGSFEGGVIHDRGRALAAFADRTMPRGWVPSVKLAPLDRRGPKEANRIAVGMASDLVDMGVLQRAWDKQGEVYYGPSDAALPKRLTTNPSDEWFATAAVDARPSTKVADASFDVETFERGGGGGGESNVGMFSESEPVKTGTMPPPPLLTPPPAQPTGPTQTQPVEFPELVDLARRLQATPQVVKAFRKVGKLGEFRGEGGIRLTAELFTKGNEHQLAATLAHEIGHLVDWLPDNTLKRGNLLGRLQTLQGFLKHSFTATDGTTITNTEIRAELIALSDKWRPWDPDKASASFRTYRHSGRELYADALSVLLNNPGLLESDAPTFYQQFFDLLDRKPDVKAAYFDLQEVLSGTREELIARRRAGVRGMFALGDTKAVDIQRVRQEERKRSLKDVWFRLRVEHVDKNAAVTDRIAALERRGVRINPDDDPRYMLEERTYLGAKLQGFTARRFQPVYETVQTGGIGWDRFREALLYERIIAGDRSEIGNPRGLSPAVAGELYDDLKHGLDPEQQRELGDAMTAFRAGVREVVDQAHEVGLYSDESYAEMEKNPAYATFRVIEHLERDVTSRIYHQIGTLKDIADVGAGTILKSLVTLRAIEHQKVKVAAFAALEQAELGIVQQAKEVWGGKGRTPIDPPDPKKQTLVTYYDKGRLRGKWVPPYIANSLNNDSIAVNSVVLEALRFANGRWFRPVFVLFNTGFQTWNVQRDFWREWKNTPTLTVARAVKRYAQGRHLARLRAFGLPKVPSPAQQHAADILREAEEARILTVTMNDLIAGRTVEDTEIDDIFARMGLLDRVNERPRRLLRPFRAVLDWIRKTGDFIETLPKAAAIYEFMGDGTIADLTPAQRSFIRRKVGTPDILAGGTLKPIQNELLLFSNVYIQGLRSDLEQATTPGTRGEWWWKTAKLNIAPKLLSFAMIYGLAAVDDDDVPEWLKGIRKAFLGMTEYDLTNYTNLPLGVDAHGNSIYVRLPNDDVGRVIGGIAWKLLRTLTGQWDVLQSATQILDYTAGQFPGVTPTLGVADDVGQLVAGGRVYDPFRNRFLLTEDEAKARDWRTVKKFVGYEFQQLGGSILWKFYPGEERPRERTPLQQILEFPVVSNVVGRSLKVTNYGQTERLRDTQAGVARTEARQRLTERDAVSETIQEYLALPATEQTARRQDAMVSALADRLYGNDQEERRDRLPQLRTKLRVGVARGDADPLVDAVLSATSNNQKVAIIQQAGQEMTAADFDTWLRAAVRERVISDNLDAAVRRAQHRQMPTAALQAQ